MYCNRMGFELHQCKRIKRENLFQLSIISVKITERSLIVAFDYL